MIDYVSLEDVRQGRILASTRVRLEAAPSRARRRLRDGDVLFGTVRPNLQSHAQYRGGLKNPVASTGFAVIRARDGEAVPSFLAQWVLGYDASRQVERLIAGSNYPAVSGPDVRLFQVRLPDIEAQAQIAAALGDADDYMAVLERLIAKKRAIKQGMMQQLLTGKTRLPGFTRPWDRNLLGAVARIKTGLRNNQDKQAGGRYPFFVRSATVERIDSYSYDCEAILVPGEGGIGSIFHYANGKFEVHQRVYKISDFASAVRGRFVFHYMRQYFGRHAMENSVKATVDSLRLPTFRNFRLDLPALDEQDAIIAALDDAESELGALERRLAKARGIKQGMTQELLTGKARIPASEAAV